MSEEPLGGVRIDYIHLQVSAEGVEDSLRLLSAQQAIIDKDVIMEFMENVPTNIVSKVNEAVGVATPNLKDISTFEFTCESCSHKEKVTFELNPVNFSSAG